MDIYDANRKAWNNEASMRNFWTIPVTEDCINEARQGRPEIRATPFRSVPLEWISGLKGKDVLVACGGGGQQTPVLAAYGCRVTSLDISESQIESDRQTLAKYNLKAGAVCANVLDMPFPGSSFDAVIMPQALNFIDDIDRLYGEIRRVLKEGGTFIFGTANPVIYTFDEKVQERRLKVKYTIPFSHLRSFSKEQLDERLARSDTVEFSHTLDSLIGGLIRAGFVIDGFFSDAAGSEPTDSFIFDSHLAFRATGR
ncbi:MAG: class I SAM-dependent methyltransferase [Spirochaetales bacterium]|nr:class I SAM-dependent methyltransferase [Spirochaetales bacterium]